MNPISIKASYNKNEHSSEMKPTITNSVSVTNNIGANGDSSFPRKGSGTGGNSDEIKPEIVASELNPMVKIPTKAALAEKVGVSIDEDRRTLFEKRLLGICLAVLSENNKVLINNIIDITGDIILSKLDLVELISIITGSTDVSIVTGDRSVKMSCLNSKKIPLWVPVAKIIVNNQDFYVAYNRIHTMFADYKITLEKVIA